MYLDTVPPSGVAPHVLAGNVDGLAPIVSAPPFDAYSIALLLTLNRLLPMDV